MSEGKKVSEKCFAYIGAHSSVGPNDLAAGKRLSALTYFAAQSDMTKYGYTLVGPAEISIVIPDTKTLVENKVAALRAEAANIRAEATAKTTQIESQIQTLLAISYDAPAELVTLNPEEPDPF